MLQPNNTTGKGPAPTLLHVMRRRVLDDQPHHVRRTASDGELEGRAAVEGWKPPVFLAVSQGRSG
jgi:hypothetical protein